MHSPLFQIPSVPENFFDSVKNFPNFKFYPFPENFFDFHPPKFLMAFFSHLVVNHKFRISLLFLLFQYISPPFRQNYSSPLLFKMSLCFRQIFMFFTYFLCFSFLPTFSMLHLRITQRTYWTPLIPDISIPSISTTTQRLSPRLELCRLRFFGRC